MFHSKTMKSVFILRAANSLIMWLLSTNLKLCFRCAQMFAHKFALILFPCYWGFCNCFPCAVYERKSSFLRKLCFYCCIIYIAWRDCRNCRHLNCMRSVWTLTLTLAKCRVKLLGKGMYKEVIKILWKYCIVSKSM